MGWVIKMANPGFRQSIISAVRHNKNVRGHNEYYGNLFVLPISMISNKQIEHRCYARYMGYDRPRRR